ncbi:hypothetical protein ACHAXT_010489 [Thalassiosira profunda]
MAPSGGRRLASFDAYDGDDMNKTTWRPERYVPPFAVKSMDGLPRYGRPRVIDEDGYVEGLVVASIGLLVVLGVWCLSLLFFKYYCCTKTWLSGFAERPPVPPERVRGSSSSKSLRRRSSKEKFIENGSGADDDDNSTLQTKSEDELSINSEIFWSDALAGEEMTMAVIAQEQKRDKALKQAQRRESAMYSTTTNGQLTLVTMLDTEATERPEAPQFRVYIPPSLRMKLLRTYHDCLVYPDDVANADTMIYGFFTYPHIRRDVQRYATKYRETMEQGNNAALVKYGEWDSNKDDDDDDLDEEAPITLDVIAQEQKSDARLARMKEKSPSVFSTANNGNIRLVTARGGDGKYRIVIPRTLQPKVLRTYHECLVNPTPNNNFRKVLYVHFTWNGIHKDVKEYVANGGLTEEMRARKKGGRDEKKGENGDNRSPGNESLGDEFYSQDGEDESYPDNGKEVFDSGGEGEEESETSDGDCKPIGLDEIAKEQKRDKELNQLKKDEPFVFSTVRYGNTLLTTAQNFRDNRYRIVIPKRLQGRMLKTYRECLLNPTPDRNFDTLLYNHFTWNGIHDDVEYFVSHNGRLREEDEKNGYAGESSDLAVKERRRGMLNGFTHERQDEAYVEWLDENDKFEQKVRRLQIAFLVCGFFMVLSSILFFEHGVKRVFSSLDDAQAGLQHTEDVIDSSLLFIDEYLEVQGNIQDTARTIGTYNASQWCTPGESMEGMRTRVRNATYEIGVQLRDAAVRVEVEVKGIERDLESLSEGVNNLDATFESLKGYMDFAKVVAIFILVVVLSLMTICALDWVGWRHYVPRLVRKITFPLFVTLVVLLWIFSAAVLVGSMSGADFCAAPDEAAMNIISKFQERMSPLVFTLAMYYVAGCPADLRPVKLETLTSTVTSIGGLVHSQLSIAQQPGNVGMCEGESTPFTSLSALLELTDTVIHGIYEALIGVRDILSCPNFNPIYTAFVYDAVCSSSVPGLSWLFFTSLAMAIFGMTMVMLRAAIQHD